MKIIHLISSLSRGGRERQLATIVTRVNNKMYTHHIIYFNDHPYDYIEEYNLNKYIIKLKSKSIVQRLLELHKLFIQMEPDIVHTWGNIESIFVLLLKPFHSYKFINGSVRHGIRSKKIWHYLRTIVLHMSKYILSNSNAGLRANNLNRGFVLYNGVEDRLIGKLSPSEKIKRRERILDISQQTLLISVANLVPYKDFASILTALKRIKDNGYSFFYIILGDGPMRMELENKITEYNLISNVKILGNVSNVHDYLKISDIFIHSSKGEGCSNAILEAMAAGLPVLASNTGGTGEIVSDENGLLFEYKNYNQIYECLVQLLDNIEKSKKMGDMSYAMVKEKYTVNSMMRNYYKILNEL